MGGQVARFGLVITIVDVVVQPTQRPCTGLPIGAEGDVQLPFANPRRRDRQIRRDIRQRDQPLPVSSFACGGIKRIIAQPDRVKPRVRCTVMQAQHRAVVAQLNFAPHIGLRLLAVKHDHIAARLAGFGIGNGFVDLVQRPAAGNQLVQLQTALLI